MKKIILAIMTIVITAGVLAGCQDTKGGKSSGPCCFPDAFSSSSGAKPDPNGSPYPGETGPPAPPFDAPTLEAFTPGPSVDAAPRAPGGKSFMGTSNVGIVPGSCQFFLMGGDRTGIGAGDGTVIGAVEGGCLLETPDWIVVIIKLQKRNSDGEWENQGATYPDSTTPPQWPESLHYPDYAECKPGSWRVLGAIHGVTSAGKPFLDGGVGPTKIITQSDCNRK